MEAFSTEQTAKIQEYLQGKNGVELWILLSRKLDGREPRAVPLYLEITAAGKITKVEVGLKQDEYGKTIDLLKKVIVEWTCPKLPRNGSCNVVLKPEPVDWHPTELAPAELSP
jgi:hypothetical protein